MFFRQHIRDIPTINPNFWSFSISGVVRHPLILSYADLRALPSQTIRAAITCSGMNGDHALVGEAVWLGVPLRALLDDLTVDPAARYARIHAADGYSAVLPLDALADALLAYEMDGSLLPPQHGFPARLIAPGRAGYKMPKWIERVELTASPDGGFWESRGWSLDGRAAVTVALTDHHPANGALELSGIAYAGSRPLQSVEVSIDGGGWMPVALTTAEPGTLARWHVTWTPPADGDYNIRVRASDGENSAERARIVRSRA